LRRWDVICNDTNIHKVIRIAAASSDGKVVNQHFGHAEQFLIFEYDGITFNFLELRGNKPTCNIGTHNDDALSRAVDLISDCKYVIVNKIGTGAVSALLLKNIKAFVDTDFIENSLQKLVLSEKLKYKMRKIGTPVNP